MISFIAGILSLTILGILIVAILNKKTGYKAGLVFVGAGAILGGLLIPLFWKSEIFSHTLPWFKVGNLQWNLEFVVDSAAILMISLISVIGFLVYWYSMYYLRNGTGHKRYFLLLLFFILSMFGLVVSANLFQFFFFWELVSFCSYGLIGFYNEKVFAAKAATKAFLVNRVADLFIVVGLGLIYQEHQSLSLLTLTGAGSISFLAGLCLLIGASGKSAQYPFSIWLPDAMAGPTPVSAFIHAATMVTAGIILLIRIYFLLPEEVITFMAFLGAITATLGAIVALVQHDIKKVLAYSTISQLGYMVVGLGAGAWDASLFHLFTHAFFKAGLFLTAGAVILYLKKMQKEQNIEFNPQDMRFMGGMKKYMPLIFISFMLCGMALIGVPLFSGFLSKDAIIAGAYSWAASKGSSIFYIVPDLAFFTIVITAIYMVRMWSLVFLGECKALKQYPDKVMELKFNSVPVKVSSILLALLSIGVFVSLNPLNVETNWVTPGIREYLAFNTNAAPIPETENHLFVAIISITMILIGGAFAWWRYRPAGGYHTNYITYNFNKPHLLLAHHHFYLDNIYRLGALAMIKTGKAFTWTERNIFDNIVHKFAIVNVVIAHAVKLADKYIIDGIVNFSAFFAGYIGQKAKSLASGKIQGQLVAAIFFFIILLMIIYIRSIRCPTFSYHY